MEPYRSDLPLKFPATDDPNQPARCRQNVGVAMLMRLVGVVTADVKVCYSETLLWIVRRDGRPLVEQTVNEEMKYDCC